ncbi:hypothetical protein FACS1894200_10240 [Spirochaetia bacterium]|nr:hypothetical protein FACS1894200_10240 [Spirochaetia bacterium]
MDTQFEAIINKAVQKRGSGLFADARYCRATLADDAEGKCQFEIRRLCTLLEADAYNQIINTPDIELTKDRLVQDMFTQHSMDRDLAREMVDFLALFVCGKSTASGASLPVSTSAPSPEILVRPPVHANPLSGLEPPPIPPDFVRIPAGTFIIGSPSSEAERRDNEVQHRVTISKAFFMGKYAVTVGEFRRFVNASGYKTEAETSGGGYVWTCIIWEEKTDANWKNPYFTQAENQPVVLVSWNDAVQYCNWMSRQEGLTPAYTISGTNVSWNPNANGYRLPTEAEWEYACRAGTSTPFSTGNNITTDQANYDGGCPYNGNAKGTSRQKTWAVGSGTANAWGLYNMHGNVWEWCWDWYGAYDTANQIDPSGATSGSHRVLRGGSWYSYAARLRSAYRDECAPTFRGDSLSFRVVRP